MIRFPSPENGVSFKLVFRDMEDKFHFGFRPLKTGLVSNESDLHKGIQVFSKFPSPENGVSFKLQ